MFDIIITTMKNLSRNLVLLLSGLLSLTFINTTKAQDLQSAITLTKSEQYDEAEEAFKKLIQKEPNVSINYFYAGETILLGYFADTISNSLKVSTDQAKELYSKGISVDSLSPLNYIGLAKIAFFLKKDQEAEKYRAKAKNLLPPYKKVTKIEKPKDYAFTLAKIAESYIRNGKVDTSKALPLMREAICIDPKNPEIFIINGDLLFLAKDASNSVKNYNIASNLDKNSPTANMKIGSIYMKARNLTNAIPYFEKAIALNDNYAPAYRELGQLYSMAGKYDKSKEYFKKYLELTKGNIPAKIRYVNSLFYAKEYDEVVTNVNEIFSIDQKRTYLNRIAAYSCFEKDPPEYEKALNYMNTLFKEMPEDRLILKDYTYYAKIILKKNADYPKMIQEKGKIERDIDRYQGLLDKAKPESKDKYKTQLDTLQSKKVKIDNQIAASDNEIDLAFKAYDKAYQQSADDNELVNEIAVSLYNYKRFEESAKYFEKLIELGNTDVNDYMQVGKAYSQAKNYTKADSLFSLVIQKNPDYLQGYVWLANTYASMDPDNAQGIAKPKFEKVIEKARVDSVKNDTELFNAYRFMGSYYFSQKNYAQAIDYYKLIVNLAPNNKDFKINGYNSMGLSHYAAGEYEKGIEAYNKTLEIDPNNANALNSIKNIKVAIQNKEKNVNPNLLKGIVKDVFGGPIASASVRVKDTAAEAWTNAKGEYSFEIPQGSEALIVSAKGYKSKEVQITKARVYNITLEQQ